MEDCQFFTNRAFTSNPATNLPIHYHQELWNHEHFPYASNHDILNPYEAFGQQPSGYIPSPGFQHKPTLEDALADFISESQISCAKSEERTKPTLEDLLADFISESGARFAENEARVDRIEARLDSLETHVSEMTSTLKSLETQIGHLAYAVKGKSKVTYLSDTEKFPRECKAIYLKNGTQLSKPGREPQEDAELVKEEPVRVVSGSIRFSGELSDVVPKLPFPQRAKQKEIDDEVAKFLEVCSRMELLDQEDEGMQEGLLTDDGDSGEAESVEIEKTEGITEKVGQNTVKQKEVEEKCHKLQNDSPPKKSKSKSYGPVTIHKIFPSGAIELTNKEGKIYRASGHRFKKKEEVGQSIDHAMGRKSLQSEKCSRKSS